jgi:hypothetical protein
MRKLLVYPAGLTAILLFGYPNPLQAQFFKQLLNDVKQTAQGRADSKANQTTNKALDKVDHATETKAKTNSPNTTAPADTAATNSVLGAFAKAAQQNPNDTSSADLTMKALGLLAGGGGVSAADSTAAIQSFKTGKGGSGAVYQSVTTITSAKSGTSKDTANAYFTDEGYGRSEMRISMPGVMSNEMIVIGHAGNPKYSISLYPDSKSYSLNIIDSSILQARTSSYQVTKIGAETIMGYHCTHSRVTTSSGSGMFKSSTTMDLWTSTEVPGYDVYKKATAIQGYQIQLIQALEKAGCGGYMLKMQTASKDYAMNTEVIRVQRKTLPDSLFEIPSGYTQSQGNMISHMIGH